MNLLGRQPWSIAVVRLDLLEERLIAKLHEVASQSIIESSRTVLPAASRPSITMEYCTINEVSVSHVGAAITLVAHLIFSRQFRQ